MRDEWEIREKLESTGSCTEEERVLEWVMEETEHKFYLGEHVIYCGYSRAIAGYNPSSNMYQIFYDNVYIWVSEDELKKVN